MTPPQVKIICSESFKIFTKFFYGINEVMSKKVLASKNQNQRLEKSREKREKTRKRREKKREKQSRIEN